MFRAKLRDTRHQPECREAIVGRDPQSRRALATFYLLHSLIDSIKTGAHCFIKNAALGQYLDTTGPSSEQSDAQTLLDTFYLIADRRLRHAEFTRGKGQIFQSSHRFENAKAAKVEDGETINSFYSFDKK